MDTSVDKRIAIERLFELAEKVRNEADLPRGVIPIVVLLDPKADVAAWSARLTDQFIGRVLGAVSKEIESKTAITIATPGILRLQ